MRFRQRDGQASEGPDPNASAEGSGVEEVRQRARRLAEVGDDIVARALSADSTRFLAENQQAGGQ